MDMSLLNGANHFVGFIFTMVLMCVSIKKIQSGDKLSAIYYMLFTIFIETQRIFSKM